MKKYIFIILISIFFSSACAGNESKNIRKFENYAFSFEYPSDIEIGEVKTCSYPWWLGVGGIEFDFYQSRNFIYRPEVGHLVFRDQEDELLGTTWCISVENSLNLNVLEKFAVSIVFFSYESIVDWNNGNPKGSYYIREDGEVFYKKYLNLRTGKAPSEMEVQRMRTADSESFQRLGGGYFIDNDEMFHEGQVVNSIDANSFTTLDTCGKYYAKDNKKCFLQTKINRRN